MKRDFTQAQVRKLSDDVEKTRYVEFIASDNSKDSYKTVLPVDKWDLDRFNKNGVIGYQHALYYSTNPDMVIGTGRAFVEDNQLIIGVTFEPADLNPLAEKLFRKVLHGTLKAVSVGFAEIGQGAWGQGEEAYGKPSATYYYAGQELLEMCIVHIPSNKNALKRALETILENEDNSSHEGEERNTPPAEEHNRNEELARSITEVEREITLTEAEGFQFLD